MIKNARDLRGAQRTGGGGARTEKIRKFFQDGNFEVYSITAPIMVHLPAIAWGRGEGCNKEDPGKGHFKQMGKDLTYVNVTQKPIVWHAKIWRGN